MVVNYTKDFIKDSKRLTIRQKEKLKQRLKLFGADPFHPTLNNHSLQGRYQECRSINVTGDLRAIYKENGENIIFITIDSHSNLYG